MEGIKSKRYLYWFLSHSFKLSEKLMRYNFFNSYVRNLWAFSSRIRSVDGSRFQKIRQLRHKKAEDVPSWMHGCLLHGNLLCSRMCLWILLQSSFYDELGVHRQSVWPARPCFNTQSKRPKSFRRKKSWESWGKVRTSFWQINQSSRKRRRNSGCWSSICKSWRDLNGKLPN